MVFLDFVYLRSIVISLRYFHATSTSSNPLRVYLCSISIAGHLCAWWSVCCALNCTITKRVVKRALEDAIERVIARAKVRVVEHVDSCVNMNFNPSLTKSRKLPISPLASDCASSFTSE
jgi:hypothetical protein